MPDEPRAYLGSVLAAARVFLAYRARGRSHERNRDPETWPWWNETIRLLARGWQIERARTKRLRAELELCHAVFRKRLAYEAEVKNNYDAATATGEFEDACGKVCSCEGCQCIRAAEFILDGPDVLPDP